MLFLPQPGVRKIVLSFGDLVIWCMFWVPRYLSRKRSPSFATSGRSSRLRMRFQESFSSNKPWTDPDGLLSLSAPQREKLLG